MLLLVAMVSQGIKPNLSELERSSNCGTLVCHNPRQCPNSWAVREAEAKSPFKFNFERLRKYGEGPHPNAGWFEVAPVFQEG